MNAALSTIRMCGAPNVRDTKTQHGMHLACAATMSNKERPCTLSLLVLLAVVGLAILVWLG